MFHSTFKKLQFFENTLKSTSGSSKSGIGLSTRSQDHPQISLPWPEHCSKFIFHVGPWKISLPKGVSSTRRGCPRKRLSHHSWRNLKAVLMWHLGTQFTDILGSVRFTVELDNLRLFSNTNGSEYMIPWQGQAIWLYFRTMTQILYSRSGHVKISSLSNLFITTWQRFDRHTWYNN